MYSNFPVAGRGPARELVRWFVMTSHLKKLWVASAKVESLEAEMDQAVQARRSAIIEAIAAGFPVDEVAAAANLSRAEIATIALAPTSAEGPPIVTSLE